MKRGRKRMYICGVVEPVGFMLTDKYLYDSLKYARIWRSKGEKVYELIPIPSKRRRKKSAPPEKVGDQSSTDSTGE